MTLAFIKKIGIPKIRKQCSGVGATPKATTDRNICNKTSPNDDTAIHRTEMVLRVYISKVYTGYG